MGDAFVNGIEREDLKINYFEPLILKGAFNEKGNIYVYICIIFLNKKVISFVF